jgi:hypothetical protein
MVPLWSFQNNRFIFSVSCDYFCHFNSFRCLPCELHRVPYVQARKISSLKLKTTLDIEKMSVSCQMKDMRLFVATLKRFYHHKSNEEQPHTVPFQNQSFVLSPITKQVISFPEKSVECMSLEEVIIVLNR